MIPCVYRLRKKVKVLHEGSSYVVMCDLPLNAVRVNAHAIRILKSCEGGHSVTDIAKAMGTVEQEVLRTCDYFRKRGFLELEQAFDGGFRPSISIIIPVRNRATDLSECLASVYAQSYPQELVDVIVVDDSSTDETREVARSFPCVLNSNRVNRGQSFCRNIGARQASGDILAFLDSDCVAEKTWLSELAFWFSWSELGALGGYVDGHFMETNVDYYEQVASPLNMGRRQLMGGRERSTFYLPACNLLVRRKVFEEMGGFRADLTVGEDVDFCWRMRDRGYTLLYVPCGTVKHKHRSSLRQMLRRRAEYGTSEALLYGLHPGRKKQFHASPFSGASSFLIFAGVLSLSYWVLLAALMPLIWDIGKKRHRLRQFRRNLSLARIVFSVMRGHLSMVYFVSFHLVRYYFALLIPVGILVPTVWLIAVCSLLIASIVDYTTRKPKLAYGAYVSYYLLEHLAYQVGVVIGCLKERKFGSYVPVLRSKHI